jgi:hypothetical protein
MTNIYKLTYGFDADIDPEQQAEADRQTASLAGLAVAVLLVVVGLFLVRQLQAKSMIEDCLLAGQTQCVVAANSR